MKNKVQVTIDSCTVYPFCAEIDGGRGTYNFFPIPDGCPLLKKNK